MENAAAQAKVAPAGKGAGACGLSDSIISSSDDASISDDSGDTPPPAAAYTKGRSRTDDRKGKGPARKW